MDFHIRRAKAKDCEQLCKIFHESSLIHSEALPRVFVKPTEPLRAMTFIMDIINDKKSVMFVAVSAGNTVGYIHIRIRESTDLPVLAKRRYLHIHDIVVAEEHRGSGIGKALMKEAERYAIQQNISEIELNVWDFNTNAIEFYEKIGYTPLHRLLWKPLLP